MPTNQRMINILQAAREYLKPQFWIQGHAVEYYRGGNPQRYLDFVQVAGVVQFDNLPDLRGAACKACLAGAVFLSARGETGDVDAKEFHAVLRELARTINPTTKRSAYDTVAAFNDSNHLKKVRAVVEKTIDRLEWK